MRRPSQIAVLAMFAFAFLVGLAILAFGADVVAPYDPNQTSIYERHTPPGERADRPFGTNFLGQDEFRKLLAATKTSLTIGLLAAGLAAGFGTALGIVSGFLRGWVDQLVMRIVDLQMAFPTLMLALFVLTVIGPGFVNLVAVLAISRWPIFARVARGVTLSLRGQQFVEAAIAVGCRDRRIMSRHILPNVVFGQLTLGVLEVSRVILTEGGLSFLGVGVTAPQVSWGLMLAEGRGYIGTAWWEVTFPGVAILLTSLSLNFAATWVRHVADPFKVATRAQR